MGYPYKSKNFVQRYAMSDAQVVDAMEQIENGVSLKDIAIKNGCGTECVRKSIKRYLAKNPEK